MPVVRPSRLRAFVLALLVGAAVTPAAASAAQVDVRLGGETTTISADRVAAEGDVAAENWGGRAAGVENRDALSLRKLISLVEGDPATVDGVTVTGAGATATLDGGALAEPPPFGDGPAIPPLLWVDDNGLHYARSAQDGTLEDRIDVGGDGTIVVDVSGGEKLQVTARSDRRRVSVRQKVAFTASVEPERDGLTYEWHFGDDATGEGARASHRYAEPGTYEAYVTVTDGTISGTSEPITVRVGKAKEPEKASTSSGGASDGDSATGSSTGGSTGGSGSSGGASSGGSASGASPSSAGSSAAPPHSASAPRTTPRRRTPDEPAKTTTTQDPTVRGDLLTAQTPTTAAPAPTPAGTTREAAATRRDRGIHVPVGVWIGGASGLLVVAGAWSELRRGRRWEAA
ncbi:PKD domain-containing protein [Patulibacter sp. S7RM1-6]